jgi:hypothetical protein
VTKVEGEQNQCSPPYRQALRSRPREWCLASLHVILGWILCGEAGRGRLLVIGVGVVDEPQSAVGKDFEADVAAHLGPFVVLFGEHGADQTDQCVPGGGRCDDVGASAKPG